LSAITFVVFGGLAVQKIAALTRAKVHQAVLDLVTLRARDISAFFEDRSRVVTTVLADPTLMSWWQGYDQYRRPLTADPGWAHVQAFFLAIERGDPSVQAVFFSTDSTAEYFRSAGRVERPGYNPKDRWWWGETIAKNHLYVATPGVDAGTGDLAVTVETTVYAPGGRFLGVAGIDVLLLTVGKLIDNITYEGAGNAFLVDEHGRIIYFPAVDFTSLPRGARVTTELAAIDQLFPDTQGFAALAQQLHTPGPGFARVRWRGDDRFVIHVPVHSEYPELHWTLGLAVPDAVIHSPIERVRLLTALAILLAMAAIAGVTLGVTRRIDSQLRAADRQRAEALAEANARLLEADQMKSRFLATMSHELRTPLNSIIGFSTILRTRIGDQLDPRYLKFLDNIRTSGEHLLAMISDILDLSKVEAGRLELHPETVQVPGLVDGVCDIVRALAKERRIEVAVDVPSDLPEVTADPVRVKQILLNLLSNAVKFAYEGSTVRVAIGVLEAEASPLHVRALSLSIADRGIGIAPADQHVIFEEFRQVFQTDGRTYGGTGLGLALVKRLVELHRGSITVDSTLGEGSTFTVVLPVQFEGNETSGPHVTLAAAVEGTRVLVVEDDPAAFERIRHDLQGAGYQVAWSRTGTDAVALAMDQHPAAIVLDIVLPGRDGWDILRDLKGHPETSRIPVIIVSVLANHELGLALGAEAYFTKPVDREHLLARLAELVPQPPATEPSVLLIDDEATLHELVDEMLRGHGYQLRHAFSGTEGLEMSHLDPPDVIILDLMMPGIDGFEVATRLKADPATRGIPIVVLTARDTTREERLRLRGKIEVLLNKGDSGTTKLAPLIRSLLAHRPPATQRIS
ncbi:MAG: response regulator, partial [Thermoanaerobaculaceae bacterium]|nr:response regulator [Thermoanaerobaculaceae bacterium]